MTTGVMLLTVLDSTRNQHQDSAPCALAAGVSVTAAAGVSVTAAAGASSVRGARTGRPPRAGRSARSGPSRRGPSWGREGAEACSRANYLAVWLPLYIQTFTPIRPNVVRAS